jgi:flagellar biosynthesis component FlhA
MIINLTIDDEYLHEKIEARLKDLVEEVVTEQLYYYSITETIQKEVNKQWIENLPSIVAESLADQGKIKKEIETVIRNKLQRQVTMLLKEAEKKEERTWNQGL